MKKIFIFLIKTYQKALSPFLGQCCRFYPSCSEYCIQAIEKYGLFKGLFKGIWRVLRCGPWTHGGVDEP